MPIDKRKAGFFEEKLEDFFQKTGREHLPWRKKKITAYEVWVSEIMLQQTQVSRVIGYYERFMKKFPTVEKLATASWEEFLPYYQGLGYYMRGRNMLLAARMVVDDYGGKFPEETAKLRKLPGIGPYTAAAIQSFAYGLPAISWDTNVLRVLGRFFLGAKERAKGEEADLEKVLRMERKKLNAALMDFGSAICVSRPKCAACMLRPRCAYSKAGGQLEKKIPKKKIAFNMAEAEAWVFLHEGHRQYFSSRKKAFKPFVLPAGSHSRAGIKQWFLEHHGLTLAVRPPHKRLLVRKKPVIWVNAQVLLGDPAFPVFPKNSIGEYNKNQK
ncbi:MAG: hypothetical protein A2808_02755 [Candidatus Moranbacteria bacterium RIFCSPHIGHO2_01_FULL_55_24]|nr:MAG: hypothetical protein A2808_02755 [Candidatus Moranbacteria bacterium RIFCSPHIGHO2_01_FULL_55_24]